MFESLPTIRENFADYSRVYEERRYKHNGYTTGLYSNPRPVKYFIAKSHVPYVVSKLGLRRSNVVTSSYAIAVMLRTVRSFRAKRIHVGTPSFYRLMCPI